VLLLAVGCFIAGYTLLYAGIRGVDWDQPWKLLIPSGAGSGAPGAPGAPPAQAPPAVGIPQGPLSGLPNVTV
jgi:hypothetical protein